MTVIHLSCPDPDGPDVNVDHDDVTIVEVAGHQWARWRCPHCGTIGMRELRQRTADLLAAAGCAVERHDAPTVTTTGDNRPISPDEADLLARRLRELADLGELA